MVYSIPGSGTRFACKYLIDVLGYQQVAPQYIRDHHVKDLFFTQYHVDASPNRRTALASKVAGALRNGLKVIVPVRSPTATAITRATHMRDKTVQMTHDLWRVLRETIDGYDSVMLPVEAPWFDHDRLLRMVCKHLDRDPHEEKHKQYVAEWKKVGARGPGPRAERVEYDKTGRSSISDHVLAGQDSSVFDEETAWYIDRLAKLFAGPYMVTR